MPARPGPERGARVPPQRAMGVPAPDPALAFPAPRIPDHPVLSRAALRRNGTVSIPALLDVGTPVHAISGRMALASGLALLGLGEGDRILLPAYHCAALVEPVVWRGITPDFYRVGPDTHVDLDDVARRLTPATRALFAIHYFGFPQPMARLRSFCDERGLLLIEDCAHALFGIEGGRAFGTTGDIAIASTWKFLPVLDGGLLVSARRDLSAVPAEGSGVAFDAKSLLNTYERGWEYGRLPVSRALCWLPLRLRAALGSLRKGRGPGRGALAAPRGSQEFPARWVGKRPSRISSWIVRRASLARVVDRRRDHYARLLEALGALRGARPLFPTLPEGVVPYVFPMLFDEPERLFPPLKRRGVPIVRFGEFLWPGVDARTCPVAADYSRRVFQFPCHQELRSDELSWLISEVKAALG